MGVDAKLLDSLLIEQKALRVRRDQNSDQIKSCREESNRLQEEIYGIGSKITDVLDEATK